MNTEHAQAYYLYYNIVGLPCRPRHCRVRVPVIVFRFLFRTRSALDAHFVAAERLGSFAVDRG